MILYLIFIVKILFHLYFFNIITINNLNSELINLKAIFLSMMFTREDKISFEKLGSTTCVYIKHEQERVLTRTIVKNHSETIEQLVKKISYVTIQLG